MVVAGRVAQVHRGIGDAEALPGHTAIKVAHNQVHPGMLYDEASGRFLADPSAHAGYDPTRLQFDPNTHTTVVHGYPASAAPGLVQPYHSQPMYPQYAPQAPAQITINNHSHNHAAPLAWGSVPWLPAGAPAAQAQMLLPAAPPGFAVEAAMAPSRGLPAPAAAPAGSPATSPGASPQIDDVAAARNSGVRRIRQLQTDVWPPEREHVADLSSVWLTHRDANSELALSASVPSGVDVEQFARLVLAARADAQGRIAKLGKIAQQIGQATSPERVGVMLARAELIATGD